MKPKEFWCVPTKNSFIRYDAFLKLDKDFSTLKPKELESAIDVIEKSVVERLQALHLERTKLTEKVILENDQLAAKLEIAKKALEFYASPKNWFDSDDNRGDEFMEIIDEDGWRNTDNHDHLVGGLRARQALDEIKKDVV